MTPTTVTAKAQAVTPLTSTTQSGNDIFPSTDGIPGPIGVPVSQTLRRSPADSRLTLAAPPIAA
jgi:hypothetical protein